MTLPNLKPFSLGMQKFSPYILSWALLTLGIALVPVQVQSAGPRIIRDAEIENLLRDYMIPVFRAAGLPIRNAEVVIINNPSFNAFVVGGSRIFMNSGVLLDAKTPNEVIGVLAHETGHLAGGHLARLRLAAEKAQTLSVIATLLGAGAIAAGASTNNNSLTSVGTGIVQAGSGAAQNSFLSYRRSEEISADRAALTYLNRTGQSAKGMLTTFRRMADHDLLSRRYASPYGASHPSPRDRIELIETLAKKSKYYSVLDPPERQLRHDLARAKLLAFTTRGTAIRNGFPSKDKSLAADYARAISKLRFAKPKDTIRAINNLIRKQPNNPYFYELKGQAYIESGNPALAISSLQKAISLAPKQGLIRIYLGHAMVASNNKSLLPSAIQHLNRGLKSEPSSQLAYRQLAIAHAKSGNGPLASLATAKGFLVGGDIKGAKAHAKRAQNNLKRGSPGWVQAQDILNFRPAKLRR